MRFSLLTLGLFAGLTLVSSALAGPNENGVLILHVNETLLYPTHAPFCGESELEVCSLANTRVDTTGVVLVYALAAFPASNDPRLAGVTFNIEYDEAQIGLLEWGNCGDYELPQMGWPASGQGNAVTWGSAQTGHLTEIYWFAAYAPYGNPVEFALAPHHRGLGDRDGCCFADDSIPAYLDPIIDFGVLGFNTDGYLPCPYPQPSNCTLQLRPSKITVYEPCGASFPVILQVEDVVSLAAFEVCAGYNESHLNLETVEIDPAFLGSTGRQVYPLDPVSCVPLCQSSGIRFGAVTAGLEPAPSGNGPLARLQFSPLAAGGGTDSLCLEDEELTDAGIPPWGIEVIEATGVEINYSPYCYGDFNGTGDVTVMDLIQIVPRWHCCVEDGCFVEAFDVNLLERGNYCASSGDSCIDIVDVQTVAGRWHLGCPGTRPASQPIAMVPTPTVRISPALSMITALAGDTTSIALAVEDALGLGAFEARISFDPAVLQVESVLIGEFLGITGRLAYTVGPDIDNEQGDVRFGACTVGFDPGVDGGGPLARIVFRIEACDQTTDLGISEVILTATDGWPQEVGDLLGGSMEIGCSSSAPPVLEATGYALLPNRPNPMTSSTEISFSIPRSVGDHARVRIAIYNAQGRLVRALLERDCGPGWHRVEWDARDGSGKIMPTGTYFCRLACESTVLHRQILLVR